ncbi:hypothetical protein ACOACO_18055 [Nocardioides sp. CPCC 205120]
MPPPGLSSPADPADRGLQQFHADDALVTRDARRYWRSGGSVDVG